VNIYEAIGVGYTILATTVFTALLIYCYLKGLNEIWHLVTRGWTEKRQDQKTGVIATTEVSLNHSLLRPPVQEQVERRGPEMRFHRNNTSFEEGCGLLHQGTNVTGELEFSGTFHIDGNFHGAITTDNVLVIGEHAVVHADIRAGEIEIHGSVIGSIEGKRRIAIHATGRIRGEIQTPVLVVAVGASLDGQCRMADESPGTGSTFERSSNARART
jgi:cytoskeletal protein CcmA (bactofilin family)